MLQAVNYISSSAENLYKFLFINGTILIILSMFYPLQQKNEIKIKTIEYNKNVEILNYNIDNQKNDVESFKAKSKKTIAFLDSLSQNRNEQNALIIQKKKAEYNKELDSIQSIQKTIRLNDIKLNSEKEKILELQKQAKTYSNYSIFFLIIGGVFFVIGIIGWSKATKVLDKIKKQELKKIKQENKKSE